MVPVAQGGQWGLIDAKGNYVSKPQFEAIRPFAEGLIAVQTKRLVKVRELWGFVEEEEMKDMWGLIDVKGNYVIEPQFDEIEPFAAGLVAVQIPRLSKWGLSRLSGREGGIMDEQGNYIMNFEDFYRERNGGWGLMDRQGNYIFKPQFDFKPQLDIIDREGTYQGGLASVVQDGKCGLIDLQGNYVFEPPVRRDCSAFAKIGCHLARRKAGDHGYERRLPL